MDYRYDPKDGVFIKEHETREFSITKWLYKSLKRAIDLDEYRHSSGAASLQDMAIRSILFHLSILDVDALRGIPWDPFGQKLWNRICTSGLVSVTVWKKFATVYGRKLKPITRYRPPNLSERELLPTVPHLSAPNLEWLTILTISNLDLEMREWMQIGTIPNLAALAVYEMTVIHSLNARVIRAWADRARQEGAFPELQLFVLNSYQLSSFRQSPDCLEYLAHLPKLQAVHIDVSSGSEEDAQQQTNWVSKVPNRSPSRPQMRDALYALLKSWRGDQPVDGCSTLEKPVLDIFHGRYEQWLSDCICAGECHAWYQRNHSGSEAPNDRLVPSNHSQVRDTSNATEQKRQVKTRVKRSLEDMLEDF